MTVIFRDLAYRFAYLGLSFILCFFVFFYNSDVSLYFAFRKLGFDTFLTLSPLQYFITLVLFSIYYSLFCTYPSIYFNTLLFYRNALSSLNYQRFKQLLSCFFLMYLIGLIFIKTVLLPLFFFFINKMSLAGFSLNFFPVVELLKDFYTAFFLSYSFFFLCISMVLIINKNFFYFYRRYIYFFLIFFLSLVTPPDGVTQWCLVAPLLVFLELILLFYEVQAYFLPAQVRIKY
jgi:Sec-independent protein secretion pathway component TatC